MRGKRARVVHCGTLQRAKQTCAEHWKSKAPLSALFYQDTLSIVPTV